MRKIAFGLALIAAGLFSMAYGSWTTPVNVSQSPGVDCTNPKVAFGPDGRLHMVWAAQWTTLTSDVIYVNYDGIAWSAPLKLTIASDGSCHFPDIASNARGSLAVIWEQNQEHWVRFFNGASGVWEEPFKVGESDTGNASQPKIALDNEDNIHAYWFSLSGGWSFVRSRINGTWEDQFRLSQPFHRSKEGAVAAGADGRAWVVYVEKGTDGMYRLWWRVRTATSFWSGPVRFPIPEENIELSQPHVDVDPSTNIPWTVYLRAGVPEGNNAVGLFKMDGSPFPYYPVIGFRAQHYPRIAIDGAGQKSVAVQTGQGDHGTGVSFTTQNGSGWTTPFTFAYSNGWPKLPGIAAELFGNVAVCWSSRTDSFYQAYVTTRDPVGLKRFDPPVNRSLTINISTAWRNPQITFNFSWGANPDNNDAYVRGYRIYIKRGGGDYVPLLEVGRTTFSQAISFTWTELGEKCQFAISTVSPSGLDGEKAAFF